VTRSVAFFLSLSDATGFVSGFKNIAMVCDAIDERGGHFGITQDSDPFGKAEIGGDDEGCFLLRLADQMEEQSTTGRREWEAAQFTDDDGVALNFLIEQVACLTSRLIRIQQTQDGGFDEEYFTPGCFRLQVAPCCCQFC
jgi:hypothetical protein